MHHWGFTFSSFPHTMLSVERVKHNMQLTFIEKLYINYVIETNVQTKYLRFKSISYESKNYLCDISCVQVRKAFIQFQCGNTQLEIALDVWKNVPYVMKLCQDCDLRKVKDEKHLLFVYPNTQTVGEHF
jgi:hypothetical protein